MIHHNILNVWAWTGGHVDGDSDFLHVAIKEAKEETCISNGVDWFSLDKFTDEYFEANDVYLYNKLINRAKQFKSLSNS